MQHSGLSALVFRDAAPQWLQWRDPYIKPRTRESYRGFISALNVFFGSLPLPEIDAGHLRQYQIERTANHNRQWRRLAGPSTINHELNTLSQIMDYSNQWQRLKKWYQPLPLPRWTPPRVMTPDEEKRLFAVAAASPELELADIVASIANNTSASGCELRLLQLRHLYLDGTPPEVRIPSETVKNEFRARRIPLNATAQKQFRRALQRAYRLGSTQPEHYLFPFRDKRNAYNPTKAAGRSWLRHNFSRLRESAGLPHLRPHDLRHQAITRMLEAGATDHTVMAIAGHVSHAMLKHYSHVRMEAKLAVINAIEPADFAVALPRRGGAWRATAN